MRRMTVTVVVLGLMMGVMASVSAAQNKNFSTHLNGAAEVPVNTSSGQGQALFQVDDDQVHFKLIVSNLDEITQAHIHCGAGAGVNGPVKVFLFGFDPAGVASNGILSQGTFTADDFTASCPAIETIDDLVEAMAAGTTYVNVHTIGLPGGEIRGDLP